jgi:hypothetical protein
MNELRVFGKTLVKVLPVQILNYSKEPLDLMGLLFPQILINNRERSLNNFFVKIT